MRDSPRCKGVVFLLLGAIINIAVEWICARYIPVRFYDAPTDDPRLDYLIEQKNRIVEDVHD